MPELRTALHLSVCITALSTHTSNHVINRMFRRRSSKNIVLVNLVNLRHFLQSISIHRLLLDVPEAVTWQTMHTHTRSRALEVKENLCSLYRSNYYDGHFLYRCAPSGRTFMSIILPEVTTRRLHAA